MYIYISNIRINIIKFVWPKARCKRARILVALLANHHQPYLITYSKLARTLQYLAVICGQKSYRIRLMGPHLYMPLPRCSMFQLLTFSVRSFSRLQTTASGMSCFLCGSFGRNTSFQKRLAHIIPFFISPYHLMIWRNGRHTKIESDLLRNMGLLSTKHSSAHSCSKSHLTNDGGS